MVELRGADLWRDGGQGFERVDLWRCGACQGRDERWRGSVRERQGGSGEAAVWAFRASTIATRGQAAGRTLRVFAALVPAGGHAWNLARRSADHDANFEPTARKMTNVRRSHLMHSIIQVHILSHSR